MAIQPAGALFQVAPSSTSLKWPGRTSAPKDGVTQYVYDDTQRPACALAAAAATVCRNYLVPTDGYVGQWRDRHRDRELLMTSRMFQTLQNDLKHT
jgi:hypothetical protein